MRKFWVILAIVSVILSSCNVVDSSPSNEISNVEFVKSSDAEMNAATQKAKDSLPLFIKAWQSPTPTQLYFALKVKLSYDNDENIEHIWVSPLAFNNNQFTGMVANEPLYASEIKMGDSIIINNDDISDWMIIDNDKLLGGFTIYVLRDSMTENERKQFEAESGFIMDEEPLLP